MKKVVIWVLAIVGALTIIFGTVLLFTETEYSKSQRIFAERLSKDLKVESDAEAKSKGIFAEKLMKELRVELDADAKSKKIIFAESSILEDISVNTHCTYRDGDNTNNIFVSPSERKYSASLSCISDFSFLEGNQKEEMLKMLRIIERKGWKPSQETREGRDLTYYKNDLKLKIKRTTYNPSPGDNPQLEEDRVRASLIYWEP